MASQRLGRLFEALANGGGADDVLDRLCRACVVEFDVTGAGLSLIVGGAYQGTLGVSDDRVTAIEELQFTLGEGPCIDAQIARRPVQEPNLAASIRWPAFGPEALAAGVAAIFAVPLQIGAARFGALDLYRETPGPLGDGVLTDAVAVAGLATTTVLDLQAKAPPGSLPELLEALAEQHSAVHQAAGMVSVQLGVSLEEALVALRARAFADTRYVSAVAADVVARRIRFDE